MILLKDIKEISKKSGIDENLIERDWIISYIIAAIYSEPKLKNVLIFKGGNCLRKCYFDNYRLSKDLDFTSNDINFTLNENHLDFVCNYIKTTIGIDAKFESIEPISNSKNNKIDLYRAKIKCNSIFNSTNNVQLNSNQWSTIAIEIMIDEPILFEIQHMYLKHPYSDHLFFKSCIIPTYSLFEMIAEKPRTLIMRKYPSPKDYYDFWYLTNNTKNIDWAVVIKSFHEKLKIRNLQLIDIHQFINEDKSEKLEENWFKTLINKMPKDNIPLYSEVKRDLFVLFNAILK